MRHGCRWKEWKRYRPELRDAEDDAFPALEGQGSHLTGVAGRVDDLCLLQAFGPAAREDLEEDEWREKMYSIEELVGVLKNGIDVALRPRGVDHDEPRLTQGVRVVVHKYAVVSARTVSDFVSGEAATGSGWYLQ